MKSKITIDFAFSDNEPLIKINFQESDDVRDRLIQSFIERRGHESNTLNIFLNPHASGQLEKFYEIYAIEDELAYFKQTISERYSHTQDFRDKVEKFFQEIKEHYRPVPTTQE